MMSIIRPHRTIYDAAIIIILLGFVLLSLPRVGFALSYWDAIFEIGFNPETQRIDAATACKQIARLVRFRNTVNGLPVFDENLNNKIREVESQISSLDAGNLYRQLPYSDSSGVWRSVGIRGGLDHDHYQLGIVDPGIEHWVNSSSKDIPELWGPQTQFGDFGLRAFIRPVTKDTFRLTTEGHTYFDDLNSANIIRIIKHLVRVMWVLANGGTHPPTKFFKGTDFDDQSLKVIYGFARDFPHFFAIFDQYFIIENIVSEATNESNGPIAFDIVIRINVNSIKKDYPHLGKLIDRLKGMLNFQATVFDTQDRSLISMTFDGDKYLFSMQFRTQKGRFLVLDENPNIAKESGVSLADSGNQNFNLMYTFRLNFFGLMLNIEALKLNLNYFYDDYGANVKVELLQPPDEITAEGLIIGFLPIWLIDFLIPSNIEDMTRDFFQTLAFGNNGEGFSILFGSIQEESLQDNLWLLTDAEVMSNGIMKFAFDLQRKMLRDEDQLSEDIKVFEQQLWNAFYLDFLRIKSLKFCRQ